jgi:DNA-binding protein YbaB
MKRVHTEVSKHDFQKVFMRKADEEVSNAELMSASNILDEVVKMAFGYKKGGNLTRVAMVGNNTLYDLDTLEKVAVNLKEALDKVTQQAMEELNGGRGE